METIYIPTQEDFRRWIKDAVKEAIQESLPYDTENEEEEFLNRKEVAKLLRVSLVTLTDWVKRGLPSHKQRGRVYFLHSEVMEHIKKNKLQHYLKHN